MKTWFLLIGLLSLPVLPATASAHALGNSYLDLHVQEAGVQDQRLRGQWRIALRDLDAVLGLDDNADRRIADVEVHAQAGAIVEYLLARLEIRVGERACAVDPGAHTHDASYFQLSFEANCSVAAEALELRYDLFFDHDPNHQALLRVGAGDKSHSAVFTAARRLQHIELGTYRWWKPALQYTWQGVWHILIGYDHILFLITLLLPAVLRRERGGWLPVKNNAASFREVVRIVSAFTLAHSLTLALAALDVVRLPSRCVEAGIALSVVVAALNNVYPVVTQRGWLVAFLFGLLHGFGFAGALDELQLPRNALVLCLLTFNLGVELGQLAIVAACLPVLLWVRHANHYPRWGLRLGSLCVALVAAGWTIERVADVPLDELVFGRDTRHEANVRRLMQAAQSALHDRKPALALERLHKAEGLLSEAAGTTALVAELYSRVADAELASGRTDQALSAYVRALEARVRSGDRLAQARLHVNMAHVSQLIGKRVEAARHYRRALDLDQQRGDLDAVAGDCSRLAVLYRASRQWQAAAAMLERASAIHESQRQRAAWLEDLTQLGNVLQLAGTLPQAKQAYQRALDLTEPEPTMETANLHANLGSVHRRLGELVDAAYHYRASRALFERLGAAQRAGRVQQLMASIESASLH